MCLALLAGCGKAEDTPESTPPAETQSATPEATPPVETESAVPESAPPAETEPVPADTSVTITDVAGRTVTLEKPATAVVGTHNPTMNQLVILGGGGKYIAGFGNKNMAGELYKYVYPEL